MTEPDLSELIADAVLATPGVASLHGGMFGEAATYLPGKRVSGVRIGDEGVEIHVAVTSGSSIRETADAVRTVVASLFTGPVHVTVEDIVRA